MSVKTENEIREQFENDFYSHMGQTINKRVRIELKGKTFIYCNDFQFQKVSEIFLFNGDDTIALIDYNNIVEIC